MSVERNHALCDACYAGLVDVGEARPDSRRVDDEYRYETTCCACHELTKSGLFFDAAPDRFELARCRDPLGDFFRTIATFSRSEFNATSPAEYRDWGDWLLRSPMVPA